jgi:hypothetical protein
MHGEEQSGRQSLVMDDLKEEVQNVRILHNRHNNTNSTNENQWEE